MVATLVGVTVTLSFRIGPGGSGILAVFPIILISVILILHRRAGGKPTAAVMANAVLGLIGFACACVIRAASAPCSGPRTTRSSTPGSPPSGPSPSARPLTASTFTSARETGAWRSRPC